MTSKTFIIAEMAWAHDGSIEKAIEIMKAAKSAGADAVGIHVTDLETYMVPYYGSGKGKVSEGREEPDIYKYLVRINPSREDWVRFAKEAGKVGIALCVMPNDMSSLEFTSKNIDPEFYVLPAACFADHDFMTKMASLGKRTFFRIGGAYLGEIESAINIFRQNGNDDIVLLHGVQTYPTNIEDTNIALIKSLKTIFNTKVGLADHLDGGSKAAMTVPLLALPYGAEYIEKHITLNRDEKGEDFESALNPSDFREFVELVRIAEKASGRDSFSDLDASSIRYREVVRKKIVAARNIGKGELIGKDDMAFKRCDVGLPLSEAMTLIGRKAAVVIGKDEVIVPEKLI